MKNKFIGKFKKIHILVILIILLASFMRLYRISDYMTFLGDEGRDAIVAKEILQGNLTLLGPRASAGDFFLGPFYYYLIAPFLFLAGMDPVGPAIMVALFGIVTVYLVYFVGKKFFDEKAGLMAAFLYAFPPIVIAYSRSSWNPNLMPLISLLIIYLSYVAVKNNSLKLFLIVGLLFGIAMQLHYLTIFLGIIVFLFVLIGKFLIKEKGLIFSYTKSYVLIFVGFVIGWSPFLAFEIRHGFPNLKTIFNFIFISNSESQYLPGKSFVSQVGDVFFRLYGRLVFNFPDPLRVNINTDQFLWISFYLILIFAWITIAALFLIKDRLKILLLSLYLFVGIVLFGIYKKPIYDYYLGFMFPLPFLLIGNFLSKLQNIKSNKFIFIPLSLSMFIGIFAVNIKGYPFQYAPNRQKEQAKIIAELVLSKTGGKPFNFALITDGNSDHVYRYFFEIDNQAPVTILNHAIDPERRSVTDQLLVICEKTDCNPLGNPLWEVAGFGRAEIAGQWKYLHLTIFRLIHLKNDI